MKKEEVQFKLMLPPDVKEWLEQEAKRNLRSQGGQIVYLLRQEMGRVEGK